MTKLRRYLIAAGGADFCAVSSCCAAGYVSFLFGSIAAYGTLVPVSVLVKIVLFSPLVTELCDYGLCLCDFGFAVFIAEIQLAAVTSPVLNIAVLGAGRSLCVVVCERSVTGGCCFGGIRACVVFISFRIADIARYGFGVIYRLGVGIAPGCAVKAVFNACQRGCDCRSVGVVAVQINIQLKLAFSRSVFVQLCGDRNDHAECGILVVLRGESNLYYCGNVLLLAVKAVERKANSALTVNCGISLDNTVFIVNVNNRRSDCSHIVGKTRNGRGLFAGRRPVVGKLNILNLGSVCLYNVKRNLGGQLIVPSRIFARSECRGVLCCIADIRNSIAGKRPCTLDFGFAEFCGKSAYGKLAQLVTECTACLARTAYGEAACGYGECPVICGYVCCFGVFVALCNIDFHGVSAGNNCALRYLITACVIVFHGGDFAHTRLVGSNCRCLCRACVFQVFGRGKGEVACLGNWQEFTVIELVFGRDLADSYGVSFAGEICVKVSVVFVSRSVVCISVLCAVDSYRCACGVCYGKGVNLIAAAGCINRSAVNCIFLAGVIGIFVILAPPDIRNAVALGDNRAAIYLDVLALTHNTAADTCSAYAALCGNDRVDYSDILAIGETVIVSIGIFIRISSADTRSAAACCDNYGVFDSNVSAVAGLVCTSACTAADT